MKSCLLAFLKSNPSGKTSAEMWLIPPGGCMRVVLMSFTNMVSNVQTLNINSKFRPRKLQKVFLLETEFGGQWSILKPIKHFMDNRSKRWCIVKKKLLLWIAIGEKKRVIESNNPYLFKYNNYFLKIHIQTPLSSK